MSCAEKPRIKGEFIQLRLTKSLKAKYQSLALSTLLANSAPYSFLSAEIGMENCRIYDPVKSGKVSEEHLPFKKLIQELVGGERDPRHVCFASDILAVDCTFVVMSFLTIVCSCISDAETAQKAKRRTLLYYMFHLFHVVWGYFCSNVFCCKESLVVLVNLNRQSI
jgi:hypothetical protein